MSDSPASKSSTSSASTASASPSTASTASTSTSSSDAVDSVRVPVLPLTTGVVFPGMAVTVALETDTARAAVDAATDAGSDLLLLPQIDGRYASVGTLATVKDSGRLHNGARALVVEGTRRARVGVGLPGTGTALWVEAVPVAETEPTDTDHELAREYRAVVENILDERGAGHLAEGLRSMSSPGLIADTAGFSPDLSFATKVELLETVDVTERLQQVLEHAKTTLADMSLKQRIRADVTEGMEQQQREYLLRQQLAAIRKELGDDDSDEAGDDYRSRLDELSAPDEVRTAIAKEIDRLERTSAQSPEQSWIRTWLDTIFELPWGVRSDDQLDLDEARAVLDADHTGLDDVKERIVEHLAVRKLQRDRGLDADAAGAILVLAGPPGVGKTSLGASVARALGREYVRVALGGVRDEAEIRGHRRTYVGAQPGRIARALRDAGTMNPVFVLDEVDKLGSDYRGDPSSALLEVLDPEQNDSFRDHYLEVDLDLSDVVFLATANVIEMIPAPLLDRMELIHLDGYTEDEKVAIATDHLLPKQLDRAGLSADEVQIDDAATRRLVADHTREAGVRNLERLVGKVVRKAATKIASGADTVVVTEDELPDYAGRARFTGEVADRVLDPGVATGLAVTGAGGDVLFVEATHSAGESGLMVTGQLGDVMTESARLALSFVRSGAIGEVHPLEAEGRWHVHVPAGAVPKDGPSAGITMTTALVSRLTGRRVRRQVAMTGEVTLQGRVLPIGGVKQKVLAAHRAGITEVILPAKNGPDVDDVPEAVREQMTFHLVDDVRDVLEIALESPESTGTDQTTNTMNSATNTATATPAIQ